MRVSVCVCAQGCACVRMAERLVLDSEWRVVNVKCMTHDEWHTVHDDARCMMHGARGKMDDERLAVNDNQWMVNDE